MNKEAGIRGKKAAPLLRGGGGAQSGGLGVPQKDR